MSTTNQTFISSDLLQQIMIYLIFSNLPAGMLSPTQPNDPADWVPICLWQWNSRTFQVLSRPWIQSKKFKDFQECVGTL